MAWLQRRKMPVFIAAFVLFALGVAGMQRLVYDPDVLVYFDHSMPERRDFELIEGRFGRTNEIVFVLRARQGGSMLDPDRVAAIRLLEGRARALPRAIAVRSPLSLVSEGTAASASVDAAAIRSTAAKAGFAARSVLSEDETVAAVAAVFPRSSRDDLDLAEVTSAARALEDEFRRLYPDIEILATGRLMIDRAFLIESQQEVYAYAAMQIGILALILLVTFRSIYAAATLMAVVLIAGPVTLGALGWAGVALNGISSAASTVLLGLAVATGVHIVLAWQKAMSGGGDRLAAVTHAMTINAAPVTLSVVTTIVSFLCLNLAASPPFGQLGNVVSFGLVIVLVFSFTLLPALLLVLPAKAASGALSLTPAMRRLSRLVICRRRALAVIFALLSVASVTGLTQIQFDDTFAHYFDDRFEVRRATDLFEEKLSGTIFIDFSVPIADSAGPFGREHLVRLKQFTDWLATRPEFAGAVSLLTVSEKMGPQGPAPEGPDNLRAWFQTDAAMRRIYDRMRSEGLIRLTDQAEQFSRVNVVLRGVSSSETLAFTRDAKAKAEDIFGAPIVATGLPILSAQLSIDSTRTMFVSMVVALAGVSLLMLIALRNIRLGLISLLPNILPAVAAMGLWGFLVGQVSFAATVVGALTFGIVVDDTVHLMMRYQAARRRGLGARRAIRESILSAGVAVLVTSVALALSFAVFTLSGFLVNQHLGWLTGLTLVIALLADLLFLPPLILLAEQGKIRRAVPAEDEADERL